MNTGKKDIRQRMIRKMLMILGLLSLAGIMWNLGSVHLFKTDIFIETEVVTAVEWMVIAGFVFMFAFVILSIVWLLGKRMKKEKWSYDPLIILFFSVVFILLMFCEKVMADEISREMKLGWDTTGELILITVYFLIQGGYTIYILLKIYAMGRITLSEARNAEFPLQEKSP